MFVPVVGVRDWAGDGDGDGVVVAAAAVVAVPIPLLPPSPSPPPSPYPSPTARSLSPSIQPASINPTMSMTMVVSSLHLPSRQAKPPLSHILLSQDECFISFFFRSPTNQPTKLSLSAITRFPPHPACSYYLRPRRFIPTHTHTNPPPHRSAPPI